MRLIDRAVNVNLIYVPYPGSAPAVNALLGEHVTSVIAGYPMRSILLRADEAVE